VDPPVPSLDYQGTPTGPRRVGTLGWVVFAVGMLWFAVFVFFAVLMFLMRGLGDEPGHPVTVAQGLVMSGVILAVGLPGLGAAVWVQRRGRKSANRQG